MKKLSVFDVKVVRGPVTRGMVPLELLVKCSKCRCQKCPVLLARKSAVDDRIDDLVRSLNNDGWRMDGGKALCPKHSGAVSTSKQRKVKRKNSP